MTQLSRRAALIGASSILASSAIASIGRFAPMMSRSNGCTLCRQASMRFRAASGILAPSDSSIEILESSGDAATDRFLGLALSRLAQTFGVRPGFGFFDDRKSPNAFATPRTIFPNSEGTVVMGKRLFTQLMSNPDDGMTVIAVCAHEFGHIYQMSTNYAQSLKELDKTVRPLELHADFLAGYFLALRKKDHSALELQAVGRTISAMGDTDFVSPQHHGTSDERIAAITAGYSLGRDSNVDMDEAAKTGFRTVEQMLENG